MPSLSLWFFAGFLALVPAMSWLFFWYRKGSPLTFASKRIIMRSFFFGAVGILPLLAVKYMLPQSPNLDFVWSFLQERSFFLSLLLLTIVLAGLEEFLKHFSFLGKKTAKATDVTSVRNGVIYFISAGLGFAFMENAVYFRDALVVMGMYPAFWRIFIFRSIATMLGHALFSGVFALFWFQISFSKKHDTPSALADACQKFFTKLHLGRLFCWGSARRKKERSSWHLFLEALFIATIAHALFNLLLSSRDFGMNLLFLLPPFIVGLFWLVSNQLSKTAKR